jgi:hypothetical protein
MAAAAGGIAGAGVAAGSTAAVIQSVAMVGTSFSTVAYAAAAGAVIDAVASQATELKIEKKEGSM